jgi:hypothetical protein
MKLGALLHDLLDAKAFDLAPPRVDLALLRQPPAAFGAGGAPGGHALDQVTRPLKAPPLMNSEQAVAWKSAAAGADDRRCLRALRFLRDGLLLSYDLHVAHPLLDE